MPPVTLRGELICRSAEELATVRQHLALHISLTRSEPGCVSFEFRQSGDPLIWQVAEAFVDEAAFDAHQARVAASEWGRATTGIERRYVVDGVSPSPSRTT